MSLWKTTKFDKCRKANLVFKNRSSLIRHVFVLKWRRWKIKTLLKNSSSHVIPDKRWGKVENLKCPNVSTYYIKLHNSFYKYGYWGSSYFFRKFTTFIQKHVANKLFLDTVMHLGRPTYKLEKFLWKSTISVYFEKPPWREIISDY